MEPLLLNPPKPQPKPVVQINNDDVFQAITDDFSVFMEEVIGLRNANFQNGLDGAISNPNNKYMVAAYPRGHGKSTHLSVGYPLWEIAKNHNIRILIVSATQQVAKSFMTEIIGHIDNNEMYQQWARWVDPNHIGVVPKRKKGKKQEENWAGSSIVIARDSLHVKDPTINGVGLFGGILSKRADLIIVDDVVNQQNSETEEQRMKVYDWLYTTLKPVLVPGGRMIYLGNTWHMDDAMMRTLKNPQFDYRKRLKAIIKESNHPELWQNWGNILLNEGIEDVDVKKKMAEDYYTQHKEQMEEGVEVLWPEVWDYRRLYLERLANSYSFARMYQCDPSDRPDQRIKESWIEIARRKGEGLRLQDNPREGLEIEYCTEGLDLAISTEKGSDDVVKLTLDRVKHGNGVIKTGDYVIRQIKRGKFSPAQTREMVKTDFEVIKPLGIRVESNAYQEAMVKDLNDMPNLAGYIHGFQTGKQKFDPDIGVNRIATLMEVGKFVIPFDLTDARTIELCGQLMNEMRAFPDGHTGDSLMALWFALNEMYDLTSGGYTIPNILGIDEDKFKEQEATLEAYKVDPVRRASINKEVDQAAALEQEIARQEFWNMMH